jgi:predicted phage terminase large subunit-like protein
MAAAVRLPSGRELDRDQAEKYLELRREQHRRREAKRLETEREAILANCRTLHGFIQEFWYILEPARAFKSGWAIRTMCDHLEAVTKGDILRLLITVPPGMMKSLLLVFWTAWEWGPQGLPHLQVLATSYSQANVLRDNLKLRRLIESDKFQALWPLALRDDQNAKGKFENVESGFSEARPFVAMTGGRADRVKIDDPHSTVSAESDVQRAEAVKIFREGITDRLNDITTSAIVIIMQRLHQQDVAGVAVELDIGFVHLCLPMEFEPKRRCATVLRPANDGNPAIVFQDPRTKDGELLFPERFPAAEVAKLKKAKGAYAWAGQYQQAPAPREGGLFQRAWFKPIAVLPPGNAVRSWDLGATDGGGDPTAGVKMVRNSEGHFIIAHVRRGRWSPAKVEAEIKLHAATDGVPCVITIPEDPGAAGKAYAEIMVTKLPGYAVKRKRPTGDKVTRATALATQAEAGGVFFLMTGDAEKDAWVEPFLDEIEVFPAGAHDDQVDAAADAFNELALGLSFAGAAYLEIARQDLDQKAQADAAKATEAPKTDYAPGSLEWLKAVNE